MNVIGYLIFIFVISFSSKAQDVSYFERARSKNLGSCIATEGTTATSMCKYYVQVNGKGFPKEQGSGCTLNSYTWSYGCDYYDEKQNANCMLEKAYKAGLCSKDAFGTAGDLLYKAANHKLGNCSATLRDKPLLFPKLKCSIYIYVNGRGYPEGTGCAQSIWTEKFGCNQDKDTDVANCILQKAIDDGVCL